MLTAATASLLSRASTSGSRAGKGATAADDDDAARHVGVRVRQVEAVEDDERVVVTVDTVENSMVIREVARTERETRRKRARVRRRTTPGQICATVSGLIHERCIPRDVLRPSAHRGTHAAESA